MSDERLRELRRRWEELRGIEDEYALLNEYCRLTIVSEREIELCAFLGHKPSASMTSRRFSRYWMENIHQWGSTIAYKTTFLYVREALAQLECWNNSWQISREDFETYVHHCETWHDCPCPKHAELAKKLIPFSVRTEGPRLHGQDGIISLIQLGLWNGIESHFDGCGILGCKDLIRFAARQRGVTDPDAIQIAVSQRIRHALIKQILNYEASVPILKSSDQS